MIQTIKLVVCAERKLQAFEFIVQMKYAKEQNLFKIFLCFLFFFLCFNSNFLQEIEFLWHYLFTDQKGN